MSDFWSDHSSTSTLPVCEQRSLRRDSVDAQARLSLRWSTIISWAGSNVLCSHLDGEFSCRWIISSVKHWVIVWFLPENKKKSWKDNGEAVRLSTAGYWIDESWPTDAYILNQIYNATRKWLDFCMDMWCRTFCLRYIAQLLTKNLWCTVSNVSTARFAEL